MAWAFQWEFAMNPGQSVLISKNKLIEPPVPEPATMALMGGALLLFSRLAMRRRKKS